MEMVIFCIFVMGCCGALAVYCFARGRIGLGVINAVLAIINMVLVVVNIVQLNPQQMEKSKKS